VVDARLKIALALGLAVGVAALLVTLLQSPLSVVRVNTSALAPLAASEQAMSACQANEALPRETSAIRLRIFAVTGPRVTLELLAHGRVIASGEQEAGWTGGVVTVPVKPQPLARSGLELCFTLFLDHDETAQMTGERLPGAPIALNPTGGLPGRVHVEYLRPARSSWLSLARSVARRMGLGRAAPGAWSAVLVALIMGAVALLCARALIRVLGKGRTSRSTAWLCALVACLNAVCWSLVTPPFQVPDEPEHVAYVKQIAENGRLPTSGGRLSREEETALEDLRLQTVAQEPEYQPISSRAQQETLQHNLPPGESAPEPGSESAGVAASQPPLYYALQAIPYTLGADGTLLDRLALMRLLSALMGGLTALFAFLFVREALPGAPWAWVVGGLGVALVPLLGFMSGAVNPDAMLYAVTAALFYCLARAFRMGLTRGRALVLGAVVAVGLLTKLNFLGIAPGALLGLTLLSVRAARTVGRTAYAWLALALTIALTPAFLYVAGHLASGEPALGIVSSALGTTHGSALAELSYIWQLYLPRLPGMHDDFAGLFTARQIWLKGYVGLYGWIDTTFPNWVYTLALIPAILILAMCARGVVMRWESLRARTQELLVYCAMAVGLMVLIGADSYRAFPAIDAEYGEARYLLPLLPLLGLVLALAARGAGRRWGPIVGAVLIMLILAHDVFSQLQEVARFYG
jgi:Predicted membrane protein (DUF2142)